MTSLTHLSHRPTIVRGLAVAVVALAISVMSLLPSTRDASAQGVWCSGDPTILVNGNPVSVTVSVPLDRLSSVNSATVVFHVPRNANVIVLNTSLLIREKTVIVRDQPATYFSLFAKTKIPVDVTFDYDGDALPVGLTVVALNGTNLWQTGMSNQTMHATTYGLLGLRLF